MTPELTNRKLNNPQRMQVFALMARGDTFKQINKFLDDNYSIQLGMSTLSEMKSKHAETIEAMRETIQQSEVAEAEMLARKSRRILNRKLDRADRDMSELEELDAKYRANEITSAEYKRQKETLLNVSITEIAMVSKNMHEQAKGSPDDPAKPLAPGDAKQTEALLAAIKSGDTVELQRIILNPQDQLPHPA